MFTCKGEIWFLYAPPLTETSHLVYMTFETESSREQKLVTVKPLHLPSQDGELDDSFLISLSVPGEVAKKLLHYLKQKLPSSCLSDLLCSHAFCKHYLRRGGGCLEDEELLGEDRNVSVFIKTDWCV